MKVYCCRTHIGVRVNADHGYSDFKANATALYADQLYQQNELDIELYDHVVRCLWDEVRNQRLLQYAVVREYWELVHGKMSEENWPVT